MVRIFRKFIYIFLSALLGALIFFIIHRIVVFFYLLFIDIADATISANSFLLWDFGTLLAIILFGLIYGIWVGSFWHKIVYHERSHGGLVQAVVSWVWDKSQNTGKINVFEHKLQTLTHKLEHNLWELEDLTKQAPILAKPKKIVRKKITRSPKLSVVTRKNIYDN